MFGSSTTKQGNGGCACRSSRAGPGPVSVLSRGPSHHIPSTHTHTPHLHTHRPSHHVDNELARFRKLYGAQAIDDRVQTADLGRYVLCPLLALAPLSLNPTIQHILALAQARRMACLQPVSAGLSPNLSTPSNSSLITYHFHFCALTGSTLPCSLHVQGRSPNLTSSLGKLSFADQRILPS